MKLLLSGFEPFGGHAQNPSEATVRAMAQQPIPGVTLHTLVLPVDAKRAPGMLTAAMDEHKPDVVLSLGEARGRFALGIERVAVNLLDFVIADNAGALVTDAPVVPDGPAAYFSTLPVRNMLQAARAAGVPAELSLSAGAYLCNQVMYATLHHIGMNWLPMRAGFVHMPALPETIAGTDARLASMSIESLVRGVGAMIRALAE